MIRKYYKIRFQLTSPLSVGCGKNQVTDSDVILDSRGLPYVPGTSLAGVYRRIFSDRTAETYFGTNLTEDRIRTSSREGRNVLTESRIAVYDALMLPSKNNYSLTKRDMVALDEYKVALPGAKFDFQVLEPGAEFVTYIEQSMESEQEQYLADEIAYAWQQGNIRLGAKTGKGFGATKSAAIFWRSFDLTDEKDLERWLSFDMYEEDQWSVVDAPVCLSREKDSKERERLKQIYEEAGIRLREDRPVCIRIGLRQAGGLSVRQYTTDVGEADYMQMCRKDGVRVIPGTSWAGAFRAQMGKLNPDFAAGTAMSELFFGKKKGKKAEESSRTRIAFSESELNGEKEIVYTRNAIDRFTGGTVDGALYTEKTCYDGTTQLKILCSFGGLKKEQIENFSKTLAGAILDLHNGFLSVGGLTSVGHGLFHVTEVMIDQKKISFQDGDHGEPYKELWSAIAGGVETC